MWRICSSAVSPLGATTHLPPAWGRAQPPFRGSCVLFYQQANCFSHCPELKAVSNIDRMKLCFHAQLDLHHSRSTQLCDGEPDYIRPGSLSITHQYRSFPIRGVTLPVTIARFVNWGLGHSSWQDLHPDRKAPKLSNWVIYQLTE